MSSFFSSESQTLLNPRWPAADLQILETLARQFPLKKHIWIASSGSSAEQLSSVKLIALSHDALTASAEAVNAHLQATKEDIWVQCLPLFHVGGLGIQIRASLLGAKIISGISAEGKWSAYYFCQRVLEQSASLAALVPAQVFDLVQLGQKAPPSLRAIIVGGSNLAQDLYQQAIALGWPLLPSFGMTECCSQIATAKLDSWKNAQRELQILGHIKAQVGTQGLLRLQSPSLLTGFAQMREGVSTWTDPKVDNWFETEDRVEIANGRLRPMGRQSGFIKISGEGVSLEQLQDILEALIRKQDPKLSGHLAIVAKPDSRTENKICLIKTEVVGAEIAKYISEQFNLLVAPYARIQTTKTVQEIPRTELGKMALAKLSQL